MNPASGAQHERRVTLRKLALAAAITIGLAGGSVGLIVVFAIAREGPFSYPPTAAAGAAVPEISATELLTAYESDESAADRKFKGRRLIVAGDVEKIGRDILGNAYLLLAAKGQFYGVQLLFPSSAEAGLASKSKGERVRARCLIRGKDGSVIAHDCALVQ